MFHLAIVSTQTDRYLPDCVKDEFVELYDQMSSKPNLLENAGKLDSTIAILSCKELEGAAEKLLDIYIRASRARTS